MGGETQCATCLNCGMIGLGFFLDTIEEEGWLQLTNWKESEDALDSGFAQARAWMSL